MVKTISVKELRMNFPKIRKDLDNGVRFKIIYRSRPLADLVPSDSLLEDDDSESYDDDFPKNMEEFLKNIDKYAFRTGEPFDAAAEIRKERDSGY
ncbi:MAG: hypothetical protein WC269_02640 [Candidatus Gracilibacteria bacterium]|jgi:antitoxin (DNA-binding transcriptional repressor) of toxin-antitoxin stability system